MADKFSSKNTPGAKPPKGPAKPELPMDQYMAQKGPKIVDGKTVAGSPAAPRPPKSK